MGSTITKSVGEGGANNPNDLIKIDDLLRKAGLLENISPTERTRNEAIKRFQSIFSPAKPDGRIDPGGSTLRKLNEITDKLKIDKLDRKKIGKGGFAIAIAPAPPPKPFQVLLGVSTAPGDHLDITGCNPRDVITPANLPQMLKLIDKHKKWGLTLDLKIFVLMNGKLISTSDPGRLSCPVMPHSGNLLPLVGDSGPPLNYQGDSQDGPFYGRWFQKVEGFDGFFFASGYDSTGDSWFETENAKRGFDCITYAGTVCGAPPSKLGLTSDLIAYLSPKKCSCQKEVPAKKPGQAPTQETIELENAAAADIAAFFKLNSRGSYIMWTTKHVVLVVDGTVHEFAWSQSGYKQTPVQTWLEKGGKYTVRKLDNKPPRAT